MHWPLHLPCADPRCDAYFLRYACVMVATRCRWRVTVTCSLYPCRDSTHAILLPRLDRSITSGGYHTHRHSLRPSSAHLLGAFPLRRCYKTLHAFMFPPPISLIVPVPLHYCNHKLVIFLPTDHRTYSSMSGEVTSFISKRIRFALNVLFESDFLLGLLHTACELTP